MPRAFGPEPETPANAKQIADGLQSILALIDKRIGPKLKDIGVLTYSEPTAHRFQMMLTERELRLIRLALLRALDSIHA